MKQKEKNLEDFTESEMFSLLLEKPALYVFIPSIPRIEMFLIGFMSARDEREPDPIFSGFTPWLKRRLELKLNVNWARILCFMAVAEKDIFSEAKLLWAEYLAEIEEHGLDKQMKNTEDWLNGIE